MNIKIFVSHRIDVDSEIVKDEIFTPVYCGATYKKDEWNKNIIGDNTGDNISERRKSFCELTVQYWAWKNVEADYYGLCHYRRYFSFSDKKFENDLYSNIILKYLNKKNIELLNINKKQIEIILQDCDMCIAEPYIVKKTGLKNVYEQYYKSGQLEKKDIDILIDVVKEITPEYAEDVKSYLTGDKLYPCCMFVMKKELFNEYSNWLFRVLFEIEKRIDVELYNEEKARTIGHLGERLLGVYFLHCIRTKKIKYKILQRALFLNTNKLDKLLPAFKNNSIPIVFAANDYFVPMLSVTINSLLQNINKQYNYDIVVLESNISDGNKNILNKFVENYKNISLRFFNANGLIDGYDLKAKNHITIETFFRFLIQKILNDYNKVIYLDCDLIIEDDISKLYNEDIENYYFAATLDSDFIGQVNGADVNTKDYAINKLCLNDPYKYYQAGVLLLNIKNMRNAYKLQQWLEFCLEDYKYSDQDVLNKYGQGKIKEIDMKWNVLHDCNYSRINNVIKFAPSNIYEKYMIARKNPSIIHYAGFLKPWMRPDEDLAYRFWYYAKNTPYYEVLLFRMNESISWHITNGIYKNNNLKRYLRIIGDKLFPVGTKRRKIIKPMIPNFLK